MAATVDNYAPVTLNGDHYQATECTWSCELVSNLRNVFPVILTVHHSEQCIVVGVKGVLLR